MGEATMGLLIGVFPAPCPALAEQGYDTAGAHGKNHCIVRDGRCGAGEPATVVLPRQVACVPVQRDGTAIPCREIDLLLHDRWRCQQRLGGAIRPGDLVWKWCRVGGEATTMRGASDLRPGMGCDAGADAGRGAGWAGTEIKKDAQGPDCRASEKGKRHGETYQTPSRHPASLLASEPLRLRAWENSEFGEQATVMTPASTIRGVNVTTGTAHPDIFHGRYLLHSPSRAPDAHRTPAEAMRAPLTNDACVARHCKYPLLLQQAHGAGHMALEALGKRAVYLWLDCTGP